MSSVKIRSAHLRTGAMSCEEGIPPPSQPLFEELMASLRGPPSPPTFSDQIPDYLRPESTIVDRAMWQSFILMLQLHFPEMAEEIDAAHNLGRIPPKRVVLTTEAISFLNQMCRTWYESAVELSTIECEEEAQEQMGTGQDVVYKTPYRPVTGLNLIVVPTIQKEVGKVEKTVLAERASWSKTRGIDILQRAYNLLVKEEIPKIKASRSTGGKGKGTKARVGTWANGFVAGYLNPRRRST